MSRREDLYWEISNTLAHLNQMVSDENEKGRTDINQVAEEIYCGVLNIVWGRSLRKVNHGPGNYPVVDLADDASGLAVCVTGNNTYKKIQDTLDRFFNAEMDQHYPRLIIMLIGNRRQYNKPFRVKHGFDFDERKDVWDERRLLERIFTLGLGQLTTLQAYLRQCMSPPMLAYDCEDGAHMLDSLFLDGHENPALINEVFLLVNTVHYTYERFIQNDSLPPVRHLYTVSWPEGSVGLSIEEGCYISRDDSWLLLAGLSTEQVTQIIRWSPELTSIAIVHQGVEEIHLNHVRKLQKLEIIEDRKPVRLTGSSFPPTLEHLRIRAARLGGTLDLQNAEQIRKLRLEGGNGTPIKLNGLNRCENLETLYLAHTEAGPIKLDMLTRLEKLMLVGMDSEIRAGSSNTHLKMLEFHGGKISSMAFLPRLRALESLYVWGAVTEGQGLDIPDLSPCEKLEEVSFLDTRIHTVDKLPPRVSVLRLERTSLSRIPETVRQLKKLKLLDLSGLRLRELPRWLAELELPVRASGQLWRDGILMEGTEVEGVDLETIPEQREPLQEWLEALYDERNQTQNEIKVIFLGDGEAGKSHIIKRLESDGAYPADFNGDSTPGIAITEKTLDLTDRSVVVRIWDFGGQEILHAMHRIFMTKQTLYVVVLNARNDTQDHRAEHWLRYIYSFDKDARVMLVLNKTDQNPRASLNLNRLKRMYPGLPDPVRMSAKYDTPEKFTEAFINVLKRQLEGFEVLNTPFPSSWRRLKEAIEKSGKRYIRNDEYKAICRELGIKEAKTRNELLLKFANMGVCFRCDKDSWTETFLLLDPVWVTNGIYQILFNHHKKVFNGLISAGSIKECLTEKEETQSVDPTQQYNDDEAEYLLQVMRKYGLSFEMHDDQENEFIPMLCDRNESGLMKTFAEDPSVLEVWWQFDYLPDNLLFLLMVKLGVELDTKHVWLSGARFRDPYTRHSMVVERDGRTLKLYAENKPGQNFAREHMLAMEQNIRTLIEGEFTGLVESKRQQPGKPPVEITGWERYPGIRRLVVHKLNGKRETFDLNRLEERPNCPQYSKLLKTTVLAKDLLERAYRGLDPEQSLLIQDLAEACKDVQGNRNPHENPRNTYVRDILKAKDYVVRDQTLCGKSEGKNDAGQLDMEILRGAREKWTIFEALNHTNYDYWRKHLFKLLENYNPHGLKMLFLVTYIENKDFSKITGKFSDLLKNDQELKKDKHPETSESDKPKVPEGFRCLDTSGEELTDMFARDAQGIKLWRCTYLINESSMTVYHFFVHMEKSVEPAQKSKSEKAKGAEADQDT